MGKSEEYWKAQAEENKREDWVNAQKIKSEEMNEHMKGIDAILSSKQSRISENINDANTMPTEEYKKKTTSKEKPKKKKSLKNEPKKTEKKEKYSSSKKALGAILLAIGLVGGSVLVSNATKIEEFVEDKIENVGDFIEDQIEADKAEKEKRFENVLFALKENIAESVGTTPDKIVIKDQTGGDVIHREKVVVKIGGEEYTYLVEYVEGKEVLYRDEIHNPNVVKAVHLVAQAKSGNENDLKKAEEFIGQMENGEIDVSMEKAVEMREARDDEGR